MKTLKIILAGSSDDLNALFPSLSNLDRLEIVSILSDSSKKLPSDYRKIYVPLIEYRVLSSEKLQADWLFHFNSETVFEIDFLDKFRCGALNAHTGLLPYYAGLFPYQWAMRNDELETGATLHWMTENLDSGPIAFQEKFKISDQDTGYSVYTKCRELCLQLLIKAFNLIDKDEKLPIIPQDKFKRRYYSKADSVASEVDWNNSARKVFNFIRASNFSPLTSPSYTAKTHLKMSTVTLQNVLLGERALGVPGMVSSLKSGTHIVCGDGFTIILPEGSDIPPLKVGDILG